MEKVLNTPGVSFSKAAWLIGRGVGYELVRRKDFFVLLILMGLFLVGVWLTHLVGIDNKATATFLFNLGLMFAYGCSHLMVLLVGFRQIPEEMDRRTLHTLLAKPISRASVVMGKFGATTFCGWVTFLVLGLMIWAFLPRAELYYTGLGFQMLVLLLLSMMTLAAMTVWASLLFPRGITWLLCGGWLLAGAGLLDLFRQKLPAEGGVGQLGRWFLGYLPDFSKLNLVTRFTDGIEPLSWVEFLGVMAYGGLWGGLFFIFAVWIFEKRSL